MYFFNAFALLQKSRLVLDLIAGSPGLYLVSRSLEFLDLFFQVVFQLVLLGGILRRVDLLVNAFECEDAFVDLFERFVDLLLRFSRGHGCGS